MRRRKKRNKRRRTAMRNKKHRNEHPMIDRIVIIFWRILFSSFIQKSSLSYCIWILSSKLFFWGILMKIRMINRACHDTVKIISGSQFSWLNRRYCCTSDIVSVVTIKLSLRVVVSHCMNPFPDIDLYLVFYQCLILNYKGQNMTKTVIQNHVFVIKKK